MRKNNLRGNTLLLIILAGSLSLLLSGCKDIFEQDISTKQLEINSPVDGAVSVIYKQLFWWNKVEGATQYSIQVATPSFDSLVRILVDTVVIGVDKFYTTLSPGRYQWRIRAENGAYKTAFQTYSFTMLESPLDQQEVNLVAPANNTYTGISSGGLVNFSWEALPGATRYILQLDTVSGNFGSTLLLEEEIPDPSYTYTFSKDGDYKWRVKALDDEGNTTKWSSVYYTGYYASAPAVPVLAAPANNSSSSTTTISFSWNSVPKASSYTLHIYRTAADTNAASTETYPVTAPNTSRMVSFTSLTSTTELYWRVSSTDKAGNTSNRSPRRTITIQPD